MAVEIIYIFVIDKSKQIKEHILELQQESQKTMEHKTELKRYVPPDTTDIHMAPI